MKTVKRTLTALIAAALLPVAGAALAHGPHGLGFGERHIERMAERLELSAEQRSEIEAVLRETRPRLKELGQELREKRRALQEQARSGYQEDVVRQQAAEIGELVEELTVLATRSGAEVYAVLTHEQRAELKTMHEQRREKFQRRGKRSESVR